MATTVFSDTCTGTNGANVTARTPDVGLNYTLSVGATGTIQGNQIRLACSGSPDLGAIFCNPVAAIAADQTIGADLTFNDAVVAPGLCARSSDASNGIQWRWNPFAGTIQLVKRIATVDTLLGDYGGIPGLYGSTHNLKLSIIGNVCYGYYDSVLRVTYTLTGGEETTFASGKVGLHAALNSANLADYDNILVTVESASGPTTVSTSFTVFAPTQQRTRRGRPLAARGV